MTDEADDRPLFDLFRRELRDGAAALAAGTAWAAVVEAARAVRGAARIVGVACAARLAIAVEETGSSLLNNPAGLSDAIRDGLRATAAILADMADMEEEAVAPWAAEHDAVIAAIVAKLRVTAPTPVPAPAVVHVRETAPPAPVNQAAFSLFDLFRDEVRTHVHTLSDGILALEREPANPQRIEPLMRAAHSIKGAARIVGVDLAVALAHVLEDVFVAAQKGKIALRAADIDALLAASDVFATLADITEAGIDGWTVANRAAVDPLTSALGHMVKGEQVAFTAGPAPKPAPQAVAPAPQPALPIIESLSSAERATDEPVVRVTAARLNRLMGLAGESLVQARWLQPFAASLLRLKKQQDILGSTLDVLVERLALGERPDTLGRLVDEARRQLNECHQTVAGRIGEFEDRAAAADDLNSRLYREVIASRMRPFADGTQSFPRLVRDMARTLGKSVRLDVQGNATDVDRDILEKLESPLTHMIRNAVDHGMETGAERVAAGKPETGAIRVEARHRAGTLVITVADDGRGIDPARVRQKIVDRGMVTADMAVTLTEPELLEFLFLPGFSTAAAVSEYSGRGVGLDVVQEMIRTVGGTVRVTSTFGQGTTFHLQLPITLSVVRAVLAVIGGESYAFPHNRIDRLLRVPVTDVRSLENRQYIVVDGKNIGLVLAAQILDLGTQSRSNETLSIVLLSDATGQYGLIVDAFTGEQDLVVRPLDPRLGKVPNIAAGAILDDGLPVLIADVEDMIRSMDSFIQTGNVLRLSRRGGGGAGPSRGNVLVVDDSATVREVEKQLLRQMGLRVTLANDGQDGWNKLRTGEYDLVVTDIDMPRMTGLELLRLIRTDAQFRHIPVVVVSYKDRDEDRKRGMDLGANYYLMKSSFHDNTFVQAVQSLIGRQ